jgi:hypothetical protein
VGFSRTVAIKRMHPHFTDDPEFVSMFLDEALARSAHPPSEHRFDDACVFRIDCAVHTSRRVGPRRRKLSIPSSAP